MHAPAKPADELSRLEALRNLHLLDTLPEERFDRITRMARRMFGVNTALFSLVDENRQWFKSKVGLGTCETPRDVSFCGHTILQDEVFVVTDASQDPRFADNPLVTADPKIRFYAGKPVRTRDGHSIGTLCLLHPEARAMSDEEKGILSDMAKMLEDEISTLSISLTDDLTGLSNRRGFLMVGSHFLSLCRRLNRPAHVVFFDLNKFKEINDTLGHAAGDEALRRFAIALIREFRDSDVLARLGGDEFVAFCSGLEDPGVPLARLRNNLDVSTGDKFAIGFSAGAVRFDGQKHKRLEDMLAEADKLMLAQKRTA